MDWSALIRPATPVAVPVATSISSAGDVPQVADTTPVADITSQFADTTNSVADTDAGVVGNTGAISADVAVSGGEVNCFIIDLTLIQSWFNFDFMKY